MLYHASTDKDLDIIEPMKTLSGNRYIGDFVFATADKVLAIMYLATRGYATLMNPQDTQPNIVICSDAAHYQATDRGGAIYGLPDDPFTGSPQQELSSYELVSQTPVKPLSKSVYATSLRAMKDARIIVRFTDQATFDKLIGNPRQAELINQLPTFQ